jgi:hypothetical protein
MIYCSEGAGEFRLAQGFNLVSTLGTIKQGDSPSQSATPLRPREKHPARLGWRCSRGERSLLVRRVLLMHEIWSPFRALRREIRFPGLKPWAKFFSPFGAIEFAQILLKLAPFNPGWPFGPWGLDISAFNAVAVPVCPGDD